MLKGTCGVRLVKTAGCGCVCGEQMLLPGIASYHGDGPRGEGAGRPQGASLSPLGVTSPHVSYPDLVVSAQSILVLKPPQVFKGTEGQPRALSVFFCSV